MDESEINMSTNMKNTRYNPCFFFPAECENNNNNNNNNNNHNNNNNNDKKI